MQGSKVEAEEGTLVILAAGDKSLFDDCQSCFIAMSKNSFYLGNYFIYFSFSSLILQSFSSYSFKLMRAKRRETFF